MITKIAAGDYRVNLSLNGTKVSGGITRVTGWVAPWEWYLSYRTDPTTKAKIVKGGAKTYAEAHKSVLRAYDEIAERMA